jgi:hypothetical protein
MGVDMIRWTVLIIFLFLGGDGWPADQSIDKIQRSDQFFSGLGQAETLQEARREALHQLSSSIQMSVRSVFERHVQETGRLFQDSTWLVQSVSSAIKLRDVKECIEETVGGYRVLKYIERIQLERLMEDIRRDILDHLTLAEPGKENLDMAGALWHTYAAYLLSRVYTDTLTLPPLQGIPPLSNAELSLRTRLNHLLQMIHFSVKSIESEDDILLVYLNGTVERAPVKRLSLSYYNGTTTEFLSVEAGRAILEYHNPVTDPQKTLTLRINLRNFDALEVDPFLKQLDHGTDISVFDVDRRIPLDLSSEIRVDFDIHQDSCTVECVPRLKFIHPESFSWQFGDGTISGQTQPVHKYNEPGVYTISLVLNGDEHLQHRKQIDLKTGTITEVPLAAPAASTAVADPSILRLAKTVLVKDALTMLQQQSKKGRWIVGQRHDFYTPEDKYVLICDTQTVYAVLWFRNGQYTNIASGNHLADLSGYRGYRMIWIETLQDL